MSKTEQPIIVIKKIKKGGHGHHGGAWKIAYADFVTAMMAFFLLMWLLAMSSQDQLTGLSDYFAPSEGIIGESGSLSFGQGAHIDSFEDTSFDTSLDKALDEMQVEDTGSLLNNENLAALGREIITSIDEDEEMSQYSDNIMVEQTSDGLLIQIMNKSGDPPIEIFPYASPRLTDDGKVILKHIVELINFVPNYISITGHTDSSPLMSIKKEYTNWELSADRANTARRFMISKGLSVSQVLRIIGKANVEPLIAGNTRDARNRRLGIVILNPEVTAKKELQNVPSNLF